jgi:hypothetical protein
MPNWTSLCVLRRTCRQSSLYETLFHCNILSKHHHHHIIIPTGSDYEEDDDYEDHPNNQNNYNQNDNYNENSSNYGMKQPLFPSEDGYNNSLYENEDLAKERFTNYPPLKSNQGEYMFLIDFILYLCRSGWSVLVWR